VAYVITDACIDVMDRSCLAECPVDCIYEGKRSMYINPDECIDCGACESVCPSTAVLYDRELAPEQGHLLERAHEWVQAHGARGGSRRRGPIGVDHPSVTAS
jgi:NAD-dependent dihydropyrimidine dehydrogenase PreA subunit